MQRMFPQINEDSAVTIVSGKASGTRFMSGMLKALEEQGLDKKVGLENSVPESAGAPEHLQIEMIPLDPSTSPGSCNDKNVEKRQCLVFKALRRFHKKERGREKIWFLLQWVAHNQFSLFYIEPAAS